MKIAFVLVQDWEKTIIKKELKGNKILFLDEALTPKNAKKIKEAQVLSVFIGTKVDKKILDQLPKLQMIITRSTGYDHITLKEAKKKKIMVCNIPTYGENTVAEHTFALILALSRKVHESHLRRLKNDFSIEGLKGFDLKEKTLGVIGAGNIGKHVIRIARGFDMKVVAYDHHEDQFLAEEMNFSYVPLKTLYKKSDIISLHVPYNKDNHHMINKRTMKSMKKGVILINTARGGLIDTEGLIEMLDKEQIGGVGLDVIEGEELIKEEKQLLHEKDKVKALEQLAENHALLSMKNVIFTPHIGFYSQEALLRIIEETIERIKEFAKGSVDKHAIVC